MAGLNIKQRQAGDVAILDLDGEVRMGDSATALRGAIRGLVAGGNQKILLNLAGVRYIDSSGIGELIANYTTVGRGGGQLKLLNLPPCRSFDPATSTGRPCSMFTKLSQKP